MLVLCFSALAKTQYKLTLQAMFQFQYSIHTILYQRGVYPAEDFTIVKKYGLNMLVSSDDQVKAYIKKIMSQLDRWMKDGKISKLVIVITSKDTGEHLERWQFDVRSPFCWRNSTMYGTVLN